MSAIHYSRDDADAHIRGAGVWNHEVTRKHYSEDGVGLVVDTTREFSLAQQSEDGYWPQFQGEHLAEAADAVMAELEAP